MQTANANYTTYTRIGEAGKPLHLQGSSVAIGNEIPLEDGNRSWERPRKTLKG